jgi:lipoprotein signal peptidase
VSRPVGAGAIILLDQGLKWLSLSQGKAGINTGVGLGLLPGLRWEVAGLLVIVLLIFKRQRHWGWWLVVAGGISNLIDRLARGGVVDYVFLPPLPKFNLADGAIVVGAIIWIFVQSRGNETDKSNI